jgi:hypothetical protein
MLLSRQNPGSHLSAIVPKDINVVAFWRCCHLDFSLLAQPGEIIQCHSASFSLWEQLRLASVLSANQLVLRCCHATRARAETLTNQATLENPETLGDRSANYSNYRRNSHREHQLQHLSRIAREINIGFEQFGVIEER